MKKAITIILSMLLVLSLVACGSQSESVGKMDEDKQQPEQTNQTDNTQQNETDVPEETQQPETSVQEESVIYTLDTVPKPFGKTELPPDDTWDDQCFYGRSMQQDTQPLEDYMDLLTAEGFNVSEFKQEFNDNGYLFYSAEATHGNARVVMNASPYLFVDRETDRYVYYTSEADIDENTQYDLYVDIHVE